MWLVGAQAAQLPRGSLDRLLKVTAFAVSIYSCVYRPFAPFRSPTGETFEIVAPDMGIRAIGEKVKVILSIYKRVRKTIFDTPRCETHIAACPKRLAAALLLQSC